MSDGLFITSFQLYSNMENNTSHLHRIIFEKRSNKVHTDITSLMQIMIQIFNNSSTILQHIFNIHFTLHSTIYETILQHIFNIHFTLHSTHQIIFENRSSKLFKHFIKCRSSSQHLFQHSFHISSHTLSQQLSDRYFITYFITTIEWQIFHHILHHNNWVTDYLTTLIILCRGVNDICFILFNKLWNNSSTHLQHNKFHNLHHIIFRNDLVQQIEWHSFHHSLHTSYHNLIQQTLHHSSPKF